MLTRDPRDTAWSRHTWQHVQSDDVVGHFPGVAGDTHILARFLAAHGDRSLHVRYEDLCLDSESALAPVCEFLEIPYESAMIDYGSQVHHEGYGDEKSREHQQPQPAASTRCSLLDRVARASSQKESSSPAGHQEDLEPEWNWGCIVGGEGCAKE